MDTLAESLADFVNKPGALLLNFGYQGVVSIIDALVSRHDVIVYDAESHACIIDGQSTIVPGGRGKRCIIYVWYDNEGGYAAQVVRLLQRVAKIDLPLLN